MSTARWQGPAQSWHTAAPGDHLSLDLELELRGDLSEEPAWRAPLFFLPW